MSVESQVNNIADLNPTYPQADDPVSQGDNHIRNIKKALKDTFPNIDGTVTASEDELNQLVGQDLPSDVGDLEARVGKNESDIANNAAGIANNVAGIANNASAIVANTYYIKDVEVIAVNNEREIQDKADKSYVDSQNSAQDAVIAQKADKSYVDSENSAQDAEIGVTKLIAQNNQREIANINTYLNDQELGDLANVNTAGAQENMVLTYIGGQWVPVKPMGGGMIKPVQQPATAGDFSYQSTQSAYRSYNNYTGTVVLTVPPGKVFSLEYIAAYGRPNCTIDQNQIKIDGVTMSGGSYIGGNLSYDASGGPTWPGNEGFNPIRVEQSISVPIATGSGEVYISGMFTED